MCECKALLYIYAIELSDTKGVLSVRHRVCASVKHCCTYMLLSGVIQKGCRCKEAHHCLLLYEMRNAECG